ncbi:MAG: peptide chain release factor N(5)-glutamine methyltransferase [Pelagibacteraceae bacterium]|nr:peptide chain release factor N(5)-glutamine methyltransferase [Pelagibacteraceae bacterium]
MNYQKILYNGINSLKISNIINPELDSELLLSKALNKKREKILTNLKKEINKKQLDKFNLYLSRRKKKEPIAYILGFKYFWKYKFIINKSVLVPRPETEQIVEETLNYLSNNESKKILDIGTGSGCIIVSVLKERSKCKAIAIDISSKALKVAKTNAKIHHLENKIKFINIDIDKFNYNKYDLILSNPPYISNIDLIRLDDDVRIYEPRESLSGGLDGYEEITKVIEKSSKLLKNNGKLIVEIGDTQKNNVLKLLKNNGFYINKTGKDLSGRDRCIVSTKINNK